MRKRLQGKRKILLEVIAISVALHLIVLLAFGSVTIYRFIKPPEPAFEPPPPLERIEPQKLEYRVRSRELQKKSARPRQQRISVDAASRIHAPDIDVTLPDRIPPVAVGTGSGFSGGLGSGGLGIGPSAIRFFGLKSSGERMVIVFDISQSVRNEVESLGYSITRIRDKTIEMIKALNPGTLFGIIQHSRSYDLFRDQLVPAIPSNKEVAVQWMKSEFVTTGSSGRNWHRGRPDGIQSVLSAAFALEPDVIFLLSDASYQRTGAVNRNEDVPWDELESHVEELQRELPRPASIHFIGFGVEPDDARGMKGFIRKNDGNYTTFEFAGDP